MKYVCVRMCQAQLTEGGRPQRVREGDVVESDNLKDNPCFEPIGGKRAIDFATASEAELLNSKWSAADAAKALRNMYGAELDEGGTKKEMVKSILDARFRSLQPAPSSKEASGPAVVKKATEKAED